MKRSARLVMIYLCAVCSVAALTALTRYVWSQQTPQQTTRGLKAADGLELTLWASEPDLINPTNIDIDARGRVWVAEAVNYRRTLWGKPDIRTNGDRIVILEDTDGDGKADKVKIFAQDASLRSPLGIAVLGDKVIVSQSPDVIVYTKDENDNILKKEVLLTGWRGIDHDHGVHAIVFGPDGRYYLNNGDPGFDISDKSGKHLVSDKAGPYYAGCALRVNPDGTDLTVLGHNFRNPYELAVDAFGNIWQTDNDDDGNAWVRVNYVMQGGNFGYWGPGARKWHEDKGSHFHSELPGVVPNLARTGAGAPCGIVVYEGKLLPEKYRGQLIHAEAGKRLINTYYPSANGAGYSIRIEDTVTAQDTWFRPSDICVSPDGAVFISDWYDPGVGGHLMEDTRRGRIYRLAPIGYKTQKPRIDLQSQQGLTAALASSAQAVRYLAYIKLKEQGPAALSALESIVKQGDPFMRARALWLLGGIPGKGRRTVEDALKDPDPNFRILAIRVLQLYGADLVEATRPLLHDPSPQVRREIAIVLQHTSSDTALESLLELCTQYDGKDRWYLEALGISARGREGQLYSRLRRAFPEKWNSILGKLLWEFRPADASAYLISSFNDPALDQQQRAEGLDALASLALPQAGIAVAEFLNRDDNPPELIERAFTHLAHQLFSQWIELRKNPAVVSAVKKALNDSRLQGQALQLADDLGDPEYGPELLALAKSTSAPEPVRETAAGALGKTGNKAYFADVEKLSRSGPLGLRVMAVRAMGYLALARGSEPPSSATRPDVYLAKFQSIIRSQAPNEVRAEAVKALGRSERGLNLLLDMQQRGELPSELRAIATNVVSSSRNPIIKARAHKILPALMAKNRKPLPALRDLLWRQGDPERGRRLFFSTTGPKCGTCHSIGGKTKVGPDLSTIGTKLGREGLVDSILNPSAGIAPEYQVWILETKTQGNVVGIIAEDTPQRLTVRTDANEELRLK
ncbi:MAG TPA: PVC-type heme-binding CxxCH protein, partial [Acidobacteriota bacterium]|nr:PVC-type heme-binding CxxCH protein [Acidobacteriota bacterium]